MEDFSAYKFCSAFLCSFSSDFLFSPSCGINHCRSACRGMNLGSNLHFDLDHLWSSIGFAPNENQRSAIFHTDDPLFLPAGPGSGKTRVILWRTVNLIVNHGVAPESIFLSTFTEKAAHQLKEGLRTFLNLVTAETGRPFDIARMYVGTIHSLCQRLLVEPRLHAAGEHRRSPQLLDELGQFLFLNNSRRLNELVAGIEVLGEEPLLTVNTFFGGRSPSRFEAVKNLIAFFNRFSEECINPFLALQTCNDPVLSGIIELYQRYLQLLRANPIIERTDFSLLQQHAFNALKGRGEGTPPLFSHIIIDEYQDTNTIQEQIIFELARPNANLCIVGDDDQALYRFRGATVENFVQFPERCATAFGIQPEIIPLNINYRSRKRIVNFYTSFIEQTDWSDREHPTRTYRVREKNIEAHSSDNDPSVLATTSRSSSEEAAEEIAEFIQKLLGEGKVEDLSQIAFLYPSLKSVHAGRMRMALEAQGLSVYAPRMGRFVEVEESTDIFGIFSQIFGKLPKGDFSGRDYNEFHAWLDQAHNRGKELMDQDQLLKSYVQNRRELIAQAVKDYESLLKTIEKQGWSLDDPYNPEEHSRILANAPGLSTTGTKEIINRYFDRVARERLEQQNPFSFNYVLTSATSLDWNPLDLFYRINGFRHFRQMYDLAQTGEDEGPICNLSLISQYLGRFVDTYFASTPARLLRDGGFARLFFGQYIYALFKRGESEYEDAQDLFPRGRIPFLTIHQSKGLEFPVVVLGNSYAADRGPGQLEEIVRDFVDRDGEPLDRCATFDMMRTFYVALSRAQQLLVVADMKGPGAKTREEFRTPLDAGATHISEFDSNTLPPITFRQEELPKTYSFTADFNRYQQCPRQYMIFRKYNFTPSRSEVMFYGSLVHQTVEDLHQLLINRSQAE